MTWSRSVRISPDTPVLSFVKFRGFDRALKGYRSFVQLLKSGQWEDSLVLLRSLYELNLNLSEVVCSREPEQAAKRFIKFGKFQLLRLEQKRLEDQLRDERLRPQPAAQTISELERKLAAIASTLDREFAEFRTPKGKRKGKQWQESWSGASVETLAQRLAEKTGAKGGPNDYFVFRLASLFTHNTPGSLFLVLSRQRETTEWNEFQAALDKSGRDGVRPFLHLASICLVDIIGIAGDAIAGYERRWLDEFSLPLLEKFR